MEESIREKFGLAKEGEGLIVILGDVKEPKVINKPEGGFFSFFQNWFKK